MTMQNLLVISSARVSVERTDEYKFIKSLTEGIRRLKKGAAFSQSGPLLELGAAIAVPTIFTPSVRRD